MQGRLTREWAELPADVLWRCVRTERRPGLLAAKRVLALSSRMRGVCRAWANALRDENEWRRMYRRVFGVQGAVAFGGAVFAADDKACAEWRGRWRDECNRSWRKAFEDRVKFSCVIPCCESPGVYDLAQNGWVCDDCFLKAPGYSVAHSEYCDDEDHSVYEFDHWDDDAEDYDVEESDDEDEDGLETGDPSLEGPLVDVCDYLGLLIGGLSLNDSQPPVDMLPPSDWAYDEECNDTHKRPELDTIHEALGDEGPDMSGIDDEGLAADYDRIHDDNYDDAVDHGLSGVVVFDLLDGVANCCEDEIDAAVIYDCDVHDRDIGFDSYGAADAGYVEEGCDDLNYNVEVDLLGCCDDGVEADGSNNDDYNNFDGNGDVSTDLNDVGAGEDDVDGPSDFETDGALDDFDDLGGCSDNFGGFSEDAGDDISLASDDNDYW